MVWRDLNNPRIWKNAPSRVRGIYRDHYAAYRRILPQARPFNIEDPALEVALEMSLDGPVKMAERLFMARLPFPKIWIEFDFHQRVRIGEKLGISTKLDEDAPQRLGWLVQEDPSDPLRWTATTICSVEDKTPAHKPHQGEMQTSMSLVSWMVDTANRSPPDRIANVNSVDPEFLKGVLKVSEAAAEKYGDNSWKAFAHLGWGYSGESLETQHVNHMRQLTLADSLENSINIGWEPMAYQIYKENHGHTNEIQKQYINSAVEARGDIRLLTTMLALINEVPIVETPSETKGSFSGAGGTIRRYLMNKTVRINIPARKPVKQIRRLLGVKIKSHKARHEVRGHWRTIIHKDDHIRKRTQPDGQIIEEFIAKGQLERVWVKNHERGDAGVGYVKHDYQVDKHAN